jgi:hypothetical protein
VPLDVSCASARNRLDTSASDSANVENRFIYNLLKKTNLDQRRSN